MDMDDAFEMVLDKFQQQAEEHGIYRQQKATMEAHIKNLKAEVQRLEDKNRILEALDLMKQLEIARQQVKDNADDNSKLKADNEHLKHLNRSLKNMFQNFRWAVTQTPDVVIRPNVGTDFATATIGSYEFEARLDVLEHVFGKREYPSNEIRPSVAGAVGFSAAAQQPEAAAIESNG